MANEEKSVYDNTLIPKKLLTSDYYKDQLTLLLKNSYGVPEQIELYTNILNVIHSRVLEFFNTLGVYDSKKKKWHLNIDYINQLSYEEYKNHNVSDLLDKIAEIVGCARNYSFLSSPLTNDDLYILINFKIAQNNFMGTNEELMELYKYVLPEDFKIEYYTNNEENATCTIVLAKDKIWDYDKGEIKDEYKNLYDLFMNDKLEIKSMGIKYNKMTTFADIYGFFDKFPESIDENNEIVWNEGSDYAKWDSAYWM